ncbi:MAG TPA: HPF/RaiA family ribosome-associated protein [Planctomycetota bacterium]|nr:HPF/RaiA family ribosome-associated protein [Planctomycetota bacterium]
MLKVDVSIPNQAYPASVRDQVLDKLAGLERFGDRAESIRAVLDRVREEHRVELVASARRGVVLVVDARAATFSEALDQSVQRMARVLAEHKQRQVDARRHPRKGA